jgi:predicted metal-dependent hydrolase
MVPYKRTPENITALREPHFSEVQRVRFADGIRLFNEGQHWHSHEAWEDVWRAMGNGPEDDAEIVLRGLIQLAAGLHLRGIGRMDGAASNFRKAHEKLSLAGSVFLGIDVTALIAFLERQMEQLDEAPCPLTPSPSPKGRGE